MSLIQTVALSASDQRRMTHRAQALSLLNHLIYLSNPVKSVITKPFLRLSRIKMSNFVWHLRSRWRRAIFVIPWILSGARNLWVHRLFSSLSGHAHLSCFGLLLRIILWICNKIINPGLISFELLTIVFETRSLSYLGYTSITNNLDAISFKSLGLSFTMIINSALILVANALRHILLRTYRNFAVNLNLTALLIWGTIKTLDFRSWDWVFLCFMIGWKKFWLRCFMVYEYLFFGFIFFNLFFILYFLEFFCRYWLVLHQFFLITFIIYDLVHYDISL